MRKLLVIRVLFSFFFVFVLIQRNLDMKKFKTLPAEGAGGERGDPGVHG